MKESYHFIGIGGIGMSGLAHILLEKNIEVSGSDLSLSETVEKLKEKGAKISLSHSEDQVKGGSKIVYSSGIKKNNPELKAAEEKKCALLHRSDLLNELTEGYTALAVAGTHGKTTVSSLLVFVLTLGEKDPTFSVGGLIPGLGNAKLGKGPYFAFEADESDGSFLKYHPFGAIITNMEADHMEYFETLENLKSHFEKFFSQVKSKDHLFYCGDDSGLSSIHSKKGFSYGFGSQNDLRIENYLPTNTGSRFDIAFQDKRFEGIELALMGRHNALNGSAVFGLAIKLGIDETKIREAFKEFKGVARRAEKKGELSEILFLDDYAHHPTEIEKTLKAIKENVGSKRVVALFQPHRFTRLAYHFENFSFSFKDADHVLLTDVYSAGEEPIEGLSMVNLSKKISTNSGLPCEYIPKESLLKKVAEMLRPHDVLVTLGAGNITHFHKEIIPFLETTGVKKYVLGLIFGGLSCEHEISLRSAKNVRNSLDPSLYDIRYFGIDKAGLWLTGEKAKDLLENAVAIEEGSGKNILSEGIGKALLECDIYFPVLHGPFGEDGTIQGFFEMLQKPYVGPDFRSAAIAMDKALTKKLLLHAGVPTAPFISFDKSDWKMDGESILKFINDNLSYPLFVKAVHLGSSIGIYKIEDPKELEKGIDTAFNYDTIVLVEEGQVGCRELEFAVIGNSREDILAPGPGEKKSGGQFVDYNLKYSKNHVEMTIHPELSEKDLEKGRELAEKAYKAIGMTGMSRIDCLLHQDGTYCFFEVNPIPGLTPLSLFPKIMGREGIPTPQLMNRLIRMALSRRREQARLITTI